MSQKYEQRVFDTSVMVITSKQSCGTRSPVYVTWKEIYVILEMLGTDGVSSEESEHDAHGRTALKVNKLYWRTDLWHILNKVDGIRARYPRLFAKPGAPARRRLPSGKPSKRFYPDRMPKPLYDSRWYKSLSEFEKRELNTSSASLNIPDDAVVQSLYSYL